MKLPSLPVLSVLGHLLSAAVVSADPSAIRAAPAPAVETAPLPLWPDGRMPGRGAALPEESKPRPGDKDESITNVSLPTLTLFPAPDARTPAPAALVCPGGGYRKLAYGKEGTEVAGWLNSLGISAIVLKYRIPDNRDGAFQDIQRAVRLVRSRAAEWNVDPRRVGVIGFSAGGHLAARLSTNSATSAYPAIDAADALSCRPDFVMLIYPAYLGKDGQVPSELPVTATLPPTFIAQTEDDTRFVAGTKIYQAALEAAKAPNKFLLYLTGGHGYGLRSDKDARAWPQAARTWLTEIGIPTGAPPS